MSAGRIASALAAVRHPVRQHPVIAAVMGLCVVGGTVAGALLLPAEWSLLRRTVGGGFGGAGVGLLVTACRMIG